MASSNPVTIDTMPSDPVKENPPTLVERARGQIHITEEDRKEMERLVNVYLVNPPEPLGPPGRLDYFPVLRDLNRSLRPYMLQVPLDNFAEEERFERLAEQDKARLIDAIRKGVSENNWQDFLHNDMVEPLDIHATAEVSDPAGVQATIASWKEPYRGRTANLLWEYIVQCRKREDGFRLFAPVCEFVQSSGMGKSRTLDELGKTHFVIPICLRSGRDGFPTPDPEVRNFLMGRVDSEGYARGRCIFLLQSLFRYTLQELRRVQEAKIATTREDLIQWFHEKMSPLSDGTYRREFFKAVIEGFEAAAKEGRKLSEAAADLIYFLYKGMRSRTPEVIVAFEDAEILGTCKWPNAAGQTLLTMLYDTLCTLRHSYFFALFLSPTGMLYKPERPPQKVGASMRWLDEKYDPHPAFTLGGFDKFAHKIRICGKRLAPSARTEESPASKGKGKESTEAGPSKQNTSQPSKPSSGANKEWWDKPDDPSAPNLTLKDVTHTRFIAGFGRPLFPLRYKHGDEQTRDSIIRFATQKLIRQDPFSFPPDREIILTPEKNFAVLSQRMFMMFKDEPYVPEEDRQIEHYARVCVKMGEKRTQIYSISSSEPLLAEAAAAIMMDNYRPAKALDQVLDTMVVKSKDQGEHAALLALLLARDAAVRENIETDEILSKLPSILTGTIPQTVESSASAFRAVKVCDFMQNLFALEASQTDALASDFEDSYLYFSHFNAPFTRDACVMPPLLFNMTRGAALIVSDHLFATDAILTILHGTDMRMDRTSFILMRSLYDRSVKVKKHFDSEFGYMRLDVEALYKTAEPNEIRPVIRIVFSFASEPLLRYQRSTWTDREKPEKTYVAHDFWCGGVGPHFLPCRTEDDEIWKSAATPVVRKRFGDDVGLQIQMPISESREMKVVETRAKKEDDSDDDGDEEGPPKKKRTVYEGTDEEEESDEEESSGEDVVWPFARIL